MHTIWVYLVTVGLLVTPGFSKGNKSDRTPLDELQSTIDSNSFVVVLFYDQGKESLPLLSTFPQLEKQKGKVDMSSIVFRKIDCTTASCVPHVEVVPNLLLYKKGLPYHYSGQAFARHILPWIEETLESAKTLETDESLSDFISKPPAVVGYFNGMNAHQKRFVDAVDSFFKGFVSVGQVLQPSMFGDKQDGTIFFYGLSEHELFGDDAETLAQSLYERSLSLESAEAITHFCATETAVIGFFEGQNEGKTAFLQMISGPAFSNYKLETAGFALVLDKDLFGEYSNGDVVFCAEKGKQKFSAGTEAQVLSQKLFEWFITLPTVNSVQNFGSVHRPCILGFFTQGDPRREVFINAADLMESQVKTLQNLSFGLVDDPSLFGVHKEGDVIFYSSNGEKRIHALENVSSLKQRIKDSSFPWVSEVGMHNYKLYEQSTKPIYLLFVDISVGAERRSQLLSELKETSQRHPAALFGYVDSYRYPELAQTLGGGDTIPCVLRLSDHQTWSLENPNLDGKQIEEWILGIESGEIPPKVVTKDKDEL